VNLCAWADRQLRVVVFWLVELDFPDDGEPPEHFAMYFDFIKN